MKGIRVTNGPLAIVALLALVGALGVVVAVTSWSDGIRLPRLGPECVVRANGEVTLDASQMANAATIAAVGVRRHMPERAVVIALATAMQESRLENLDNGDRDSVGLFQQRPSQGWGSAEKIQDPRYAANRFYSALKRVKGWKSMRVTDAAQRVQRSAYPNAYQQWVDESEVLATALLGQATSAVACTFTGKPVIRGAAAATALAQGLRLDWDRALDPVTPLPNAGLAVAVTDARAGWRYAHWLVSHARETGVQRIRFGDLEWRAPTGRWRAPASGQATGTGQVIAEVFG